MHLFLLWRNVHFAVLGKLCWFWCVPAFSWAHDVLASIVHQTQHCSCSCFKDSKMPTMPSTESVLKVFEGQTYLEEETLLCAPKIEWEISHAFWTSQRFMWFHDISWVQYNATVYFLHHFRSVWVRDSSRVISSGDGPPSGHPRFQLAVAGTEWTLKVHGEETLFGEVQQPCRVQVILVCKPKYPRIFGGSSGWEGALTHPRDSNCPQATLKKKTDRAKPPTSSIRKSFLRKAFTAQFQAFNLFTHWSILQLWHSPGPPLHTRTTALCAFASKSWRVRKDPSPGRLTCNSSCVQSIQIHSSLVHLMKSKSTSAFFKNPTCPAKNTGKKSGRSKAVQNCKIDLNTWTSILHSFQIHQSTAGHAACLHACTKSSHPTYPCAFTSASAFRLGQNQRVKIILRSWHDRS